MMLLDRKRLLMTYTQVTDPTLKGLNAEIGIDHI